MADFELSPWQQIVEQAVNQGARFVYIKAGRKSGKTKYIEHRILQNSRLQPITPDQVNAYIAPSRSQAKNILWRRLKLAIPRDEMERKPSETELTIDLKTGTRQQLFGAENEDAIRGLTFGPSILDEADFMRTNFYEEVVEPNLKVTKASCIMASTPKGKWFTKLWKAAKEGRLGREHVAFHFTIWDNPHISRKEIDATKAKVSPEVWEQEYMANENAYCGLQYSEFDVKHIVPHREPQSTSLFCRSLDWGWAHPSHCLWGEIYFNKLTGRWNLYIYREFQVRGLNISALVTPILAADRRDFIFTVIDGAAKRTEMSSGKPIIKEFAKHGLLCRVPFGTDDYRINAAKMMLKEGDIQISEKCPILIKQLREVEWGDKYGDDAADSFKYLCSWVYGKDFSHWDTSQSRTNAWDGAIDPNGILAAEEPDTFQWAGNY